ncbi:CD3337/EF1877 family mobilome membrane protein [Oceanobacillus polygoni]|uniref:Membrane protein n=1 Tax=Oceanobacillus polygoni TaxID=1235259 RepID=A0A9X0YWG6_9BACI|nr:hypothetical protein [Oceanobacillus polygoni]MBP2079777.1 putative membrane protein [Oceanobacillus polygoni]
MLKSRKLFMTVFSSLILCVHLSATTVFAENEADSEGNISNLIEVDNPIGKMLMDIFGDILSEKYKPHEYMNQPESEENIKKGGVELEIKKYPVERYMVNNEDTNGIFGFNLYGINNFFMGIIQHVVIVTDSSLEKLFSLQILDEFADDLQSISYDIYQTLKDYFAELLFAFLCGYLVFLFFTNGNARESVRKFLLFIVVLVVAGYWMANASFLIKSMNAISNETQGYLVSAGNGLLEIFENDREGVYSAINDIDEDDKLNGALSVMRNVYFDLALKRPYLLINYGTTEENDINNNDNVKNLGFGFDQYNRVDRMLAFNLSSAGSVYRITHAHIEVNKNNNSAMASGGSFKQSGLIFLTFIIVIALSIPFLLLGLLNFALQLLAILIALALPFAFFISFIPQFVMSGFNTLGKLVTVFLIKAMLGIFIFISYLLTFTLYRLVPPEDTGMYLLHVFLLILLFFYIIVKRNSIIHFVTAGRVQSIDKNIMPNMNQYYSKQFNDARGRINKRRSRKRQNPMNKVGESDELLDDANTNRTSMKTERNSALNRERKNVPRTSQINKEENAKEAKHVAPLKRRKQNLDKKVVTGNNLEEGKGRNKEDVQFEPIGKNDRVKKSKENNGAADRIKQSEISNVQSLKSARRKKARNERLPYGSYKVGIVNDIDPRQKLKPTRNKQNLNLNLNGTKIESFNDGVKQNKNVSSVEESKKERDIDRGMS